MQQQNGSLLRKSAVESMYELLHLSPDAPSTSVTPTQVQHQPQFDNTIYIKTTSFNDTNILDQVNDLQYKQQTPISLSQHQQFNPINEMESHQDANILNQQYQLNIPNAVLVDAVVNFMSENSNQDHQKNEQKNANEIFLNHNTDQANQIDNEVNTVNDDVILDSFSSMSISSGPILDSQFAVEMCSDFIKHLDNNGGETMAASYLPNPNEQIMNFCANEQYIKCDRSDTLLATENIFTKSHLNYMTQCKTINSFGSARNVVNFQLNPVRD